MAPTLRAFYWPYFAFESASTPLSPYTFPFFEPVKYSFCSLLAKLYGFFGDMAGIKGHGRDVEALRGLIETGRVNTESVNVCNAHENACRGRQSACRGFQSVCKGRESEYMRPWDFL